MVFTNGKVHTADKANSWAEAVAVRDNEIVYVGDEAGAASWFPKYSAAGITAFHDFGIGVEDKIGSLEVGKLADLIVLDENVFDIDPHDIYKEKVELTMMDGKVRHDGL